MAKHLNGYTQEGRPVLSGSYLFTLMDSRGVPFDMLNEILREQQAAFDTREFIQAAHQSKNFSKECLLKLLKMETPGECRFHVERLVEKAYA